MATDLIEIDAERPAEDAIERAAAVVRRGGVIAIPSDALYMLVADPLNLCAVRRVFQAKGRGDEVPAAAGERSDLAARKP